MKWQNMYWYMFPKILSLKKIYYFFLLVLDKSEISICSYICDHLLNNPY